MSALLSGWGVASIALTWLYAAYLVDPANGRAFAGRSMLVDAVSFCIFFLGLMALRFTSVAAIGAATLWAGCIYAGWGMGDAGEAFFWLALHSLGAIVTVWALRVAWQRARLFRVGYRIMDKG